MRRLFLATIAVLSIGVGVAIGQAVVQQTLTGTEAWQVGQGPGGPGFFTNTTALRGGQNYAIIPGGTTITQTISPNTQWVILTGPITTLNLSLPASPYFDGQMVSVACPGGAVTTLTVSALSNSGQTTSGPTPTCSNTVATSESFSFILSLGAGGANGTSGTSATWYRIK